MGPGVGVCCRPDKNRMTLILEAKKSANVKAENDIHDVGRLRVTCNSYKSRSNEQERFFHIHSTSQAIHREQGYQNEVMTGNTRIYEYLVSRIAESWNTLGVASAHVSFLVTNA